MASAWKDANLKSKVAEHKLKTVGKLKEDNKALKAATNKSMAKIVELKKHYAK